MAKKADRTSSTAVCGSTRVDEAPKQPSGEGAGKPAPADRLPEIRRDPAEFKQLAQRQRNWLYRIAGKITLGEELDPVDRMLASEVLRTHADGIPGEQPGQREGSKLDPANVAVHYACLIRQGKANSKTAACKLLAEHYGVSIQGMQKTIDKYGDAGLARYDAWTASAT